MCWVASAVLLETQHNEYFFWEGRKKKGFKKKWKDGWRSHRGRESRHLLSAAQPYHGGGVAFGAMWCFSFLNFNLQLWIDTFKLTFLSGKVLNCGRSLDWIPSLPSQIFSYVLFLPLRWGLYVFADCVKTDRWYCHLLCMEGAGAGKRGRGVDSI